ncbi:MAG: radical SAM protein, partial [Deltaproteobacteria bacterium]
EGITNLRFYFMVGLPRETEDDLKAISNLLGKIRHELDVVLRGKGRKMVISVNPFIPKPWTPFQWHPYAGTKELQLKIRALKKALQRVKGVRFHHDLPKWGYFQTLFSMGDRRVGWELYRGTKEGDWVKYLRTAAFNPDFWVLRPKGQREKFPFEVINQGVDRNSLWEEYRRALL